MKTARKPSPIQTPAWAGQFITLCNLLAETSCDVDAATQAAILSLGCTADLAHVQGDAYSAAGQATRDFVEAAAWEVRIRRAYNATPSRGSEFPASMDAVSRDAASRRAEARAILETALRNITPSLRLS